MNVGALSRSIALTAALAVVSGACSSKALVGGDGGATPDGGPTGIIAGMAVGKFCHSITHDSQPTTLTLEVGDEAQFTSFTAVTRTCDPALFLPCKTVPVGLLELRLKEGERLLIRRQVILHDGEEYLFEPRLSSTNGVLELGGEPLPKGRCAGLAYDAGTVPPARDASAD